MYLSQKTRRAKSAFGALISGMRDDLEFQMELPDKAIALSRAFFDLRVDVGALSKHQQTGQEWPCEIWENTHRELFDRATFLSRRIFYLRALIYMEIENISTRLKCLEESSGHYTYPAMGLPTADIMQSLERAASMLRDDFESMGHMAQQLEEIIEVQNNALKALHE